jgi:hypothetical protein
MTKIAWLPLAATLMASAAMAQAPAPSPAPEAPPKPTPMAPPGAPSMAPQTAPSAVAPDTTGTASPRQDANAPLAGANSFTEAQAKSRIESMGFTQISGLQKDKDGIWRGSAMKEGKSVNVALDYRGNVVAQ